MQGLIGTGAQRSPNRVAEIRDSALVGSVLLAWALVQILTALPCFLIAALVMPAIPEVLYSFD